MVNSEQAVRLLLSLTVAIIVFEIYTSSIQHHIFYAKPFFGTENSESKGKVASRRFAVFGCSTPNNSTHRGFDYAFYLPLTAMAWNRIGFESTILIIGEKTEWQTHPILSYVLDHLDKLPDVTVLFIPAKVENRMMLSQTARIFVANMDDFPGKLSDYIITTDSDLWPLKKEHFIQPEGSNRPLTLVHSQCCGPFKFDGRNYTMLPMSHVGASAATWKEIVNFNSSVVANDSASILEYLKQVFGERVHRPIIFASEDWYFDQKLISIRVDQWIKRQQEENCTYRVSDQGLSRIDRSSWNPDSIQPSVFQNYYDTHLPLEGFKPAVWESIKPLVLLMYSEGSSQIEWSNAYAKRFHEQFIKWRLRTSK
ncbi:uncharacterized protein LOC116928077 [Daphnia magna]|uniref:uncharacterized protein LOC116928077 n=1 Tax=Daphnia magna TaxID=35525 RepID=UPI001E1BB352|nr:uncharacterized protein LOC116928077 [Daphnia magna]